MKILWLDLNSSYAHASLALPALHAQVKDNPDYEWDVVSATVNENPGLIAGHVYGRQPNLVAATCWLFNHEALTHILSRVKALLPHCMMALGGPEFLGDNECFLRQNTFINAVFRGEGEDTFDGKASPASAIWTTKTDTTTTDWRGSCILTGWFFPKKAGSLTGASLSCNWRPRADASTPVPFA